MKNNKGIFLSLVCVLVALIIGVFIGRNLPDERISLEEDPGASVEQTNAALGKIDINTATKEELMLLPGIGETIAGRILAYRRENGKFQTIADLQNVKGIGTKILSEIFDYITVGG